MTTSLPTLLTTPTDDLPGALDDLVAVAGQARDDAWDRAVLAAVVQRLEDAADAGLGDPYGDPLVVLQRRIGRAHARLAAQPAVDLPADLLRGLASALQPPDAAPGASRRPAADGYPVPVAC